MHNAVCRPCPTWPAWKPLRKCKHALAPQICNSHGFPLHFPTPGWWWLWARARASSRWYPPATAGSGTHSPSLAIIVYAFFSCIPDARARAYSRWHPPATAGSGTHSPSLAIIVYAFFSCIPDARARAYSRWHPPATAGSGTHSPSLAIIVYAFFSAFQMQQQGPLDEVPI